VQEENGMRISVCRLALTLVVLLGVVATSLAEPDLPKVAVFDLQVTNKRHDSFGERFAEEIREAVDASGALAAVSENELKDFLKAQGKELCENLLAEEAALLGEDMGVELVVMGFLFKQGKEYSATLRIVQVSTGREVLPPEKLTVGSKRDDQEAAAAQMAERLLEFPKEEAAKHYRFGQDYFVGGNYKDAAAAFERAIAAAPDMWEAYYAAGAAYGKLGDEAKSEEKYNEVLVRNPEYAEGYQARGDHYRQQGNLELALADLDRAVELKPELVPALLSRGLVYQALARYAEAAADFQKATELEPDNAYAWVARGAAEAVSGSPWQAVLSYEHAVQADSTYVLAWSNLARLCMSQRELSLQTGRQINGHGAQEYLNKAIWALQRLLELKPEDLDTRVRLASAYGVAGRSQEADSLFSLLVAEVPSNLEVREARAAYLMEAGRDAEFIQEIEEITKLDAENYNALTQLGRHYADRGYVTKAKEYLSRAKQLRPDAGLAYVVEGTMYKDRANRLEDEGSEASGSPARKAKWNEAKDTFAKALEQFRKAVNDQDVGTYARNMVGYCQQMIARQDTLILYEDYY
jgi:tetratricopeptide (TPR) repeat protein